MSHIFKFSSSNKKYWNFPHKKETKQVAEILLNVINTIFFFVLQIKINLILIM